MPMKFSFYANREYGCELGGGYPHLNTSTAISVSGSN
jgi:hypothetical protein